MENLQCYLRKKRQDKGYNIHGQGQYAGNYFIPHDEYCDFLELVQNAKSQNAKLSNLQEKHDLNVPFRLTLSFLFAPGKNYDYCVSISQIRNFIVHVSSILYEKIDFTEIDGKPLRFFVLRNSKPNICRKTRVKFQQDIVQIICPDILLGENAQHMLRNITLEKNIIRNAFGNSLYLNTDSDVYNIHYLETQYTSLYGCGKNHLELNALFELPSTLKLSTKDKKTVIETNLIQKTHTKFTNLELMNLFSVQVYATTDVAKHVPDVTNVYKEKQWSDEEIQLLLINVQRKKPHDKIALIHDRTIDEIVTMLKSLASDYYYNDGRHIEEIQKFTGLSAEIIQQIIEENQVEPSLSDVMTVLKDIQNQLKLLKCTFGTSLY
jgi:hypothetical protein